MIRTVVLLLISTVIFHCGCSRSSAKTKHNPEVVRAVRVICRVQHHWFDIDHDANGHNDYWTLDVSGLNGFCPVTRGLQGEPIQELGIAVALADAAPRNGYVSVLRGKKRHSFRGYWFRMIGSDENGESSCLDEDGDGREWTNSNNFYVVAYPESPRDGPFTYIADKFCRVWFKEVDGEPVDAWPAVNPADVGWRMVGDGVGPITEFD